MTGATNGNGVVELMPDLIQFDVGGEKTEVKEVKDCTLLSIRTEGHPALMEVLAPYDFESETYAERRKFTDDLLYTMRYFGAIGLSANQVGNLRRVFVMQKFDQKDGKRMELLICYNPEVIRVLEKDAPAREACLSFPGLSLQIKRPSGIEVSYQDDAGTFFETELFGIDARCFLHELDHLNGIVFTSKVKREIMDWEREKQRKTIKKYRKTYAR